MKQALRIALASSLLAVLFAASHRPEATAQSEQASSEEEAPLSCSWGIVTCPGTFWQISHSTSSACAMDCGDVEFPTLNAALAYCNQHCPSGTCQRVGGYTLCPM